MWLCGMVGLMSGKFARVLLSLQAIYSGEIPFPLIDMARDVLINHTRDVDINEPDGPTNLSAWMRLKNKELPPSVHNY